MLCVVDVDGGGGGEDFVNEVLLVGLAWGGNAGLCEDVFEGDDLECFSVEREGQKGDGEERGTETHAAWIPWWMLGTRK